MINALEMRMNEEQFGFVWVGLPAGEKGKEYAHHFRANPKGSSKGLAGREAWLDH